MRLHSVYVSLFILFAALAVVGCLEFQPAKDSDGVQRKPTTNPHAAGRDTVGGIVRGFRDAGTALQASGVAATPYAPHVGLTLTAAGGLIYGLCEAFLRRRDRRRYAATRIEWTEAERERYQQTGIEPPGKPARSRPPAIAKRTLSPPRKLKVA